MNFAMYTKELTPPEWRAIVQKLEPHREKWGEFIAQVMDAIEDHSDGDRVAVRVDHLIACRPIREELNE